MQLKGFLLKGALPFLLGVVVTAAVMTKGGSCCQEMDVKIEKIQSGVQAMRQALTKQKQMLDKLVAALPQEAKVEVKKAEVAKTAPAAAKK